MTTKLPPGTYYVGDPCYVLDDDKYDKFLAAYERNGGYELREHPTPIFQFEGVPVFCHRTMYGDGGYRDRDERNYSVDAGFIGALPLELVDRPTDGGQVISFPNEFSARYENGTFRIGRIVIITGDEAELPLAQY